MTTPSTSERSAIGLAALVALADEMNQRASNAFDRVSALANSVAEIALGVVPELQDALNRTTVAVKRVHDLVMRAAAARPERAGLLAEGVHPRLAARAAGVSEDAAQRLLEQAVLELAEAIYAARRAEQLAEGCASGAVTAEPQRA